MKKLLFLMLFLPVMGQGQIITTIAGNGYGAGSTGGYTGDNGPATAAELFYPTGVAIDGLGNVFIADNENHCIRKVDPSGIITTIAGNGTFACTGDNEPATDAILAYPYGVVVDHLGNIFFADGGCSRIRKISASGIITTIAGNGTSGSIGDGGPATAAELSDPMDVAFDTIGNIYIADASNSVIRKVDTSGIISTVAGNYIYGYNGDGGPATSAEFTEPFSVAVDDSSNIYIVDGGVSRIRKVSFNGIVTTIAGQDTSGYNGDNRPATTAELDRPHGVKVDRQGNVYIADSYNARIRKVNTSGIITTIAGPGTPGNLGDGGNPILAFLFGPNNVALDVAGNIYIADMANNRIRLITYDLGVSNINKVALINIYPNPTSDMLKITATEKIANIIISNVLGQTVYTHEYNAENAQVDVSLLSKGVYFIKINRSVVKQFVKE